jgi:2-phosphoglycolate phosphatase
MTNSINGILFDLDGTLLHTVPDFYSVLDDLVKKHHGDDYDKNVLHEIVSSGASAMIELAFGYSAGSKNSQKLINEFLNLYLEKISNTEACLYPNIDLLLTQIVSLDLRWGVVTNKIRRFTEPLVTQFESFSTCHSLVCADDVGASKPDPSGLLQAAKQLGLSPYQCIYVGDHPRDVQAAHAAGMKAIAVSWGYLPKNLPIDEWDAEYIAHDIQSIVNYLVMNQN